MMNKKTMIGNAIKHIFLIIMSFLCVFPFYWMLVGMTNTSAEIVMGKLTFGTHLIENVKNAFAYTDLLRAFGNSLFLAVIITGVGLIICSIAGYAFVVFQSRAREILFTALIASMMVPFAAKIIPMFRQFSKMGLLNNYLAIILPAIGSPFLIFFFKQNTYSFPKETIEAARVDGLTEYQIFFRIFMPMMKSTYAAAGIFMFMASWNNYMWPLISLQSSEKFTLPLAVANLASGFTPDYGMTLVGVVLSTLPTIVVFFALQKAFVEGMVGSVK